MSDDADFCIRRPVAPFGHGERCYCGHLATCHVLYGSGCANVCDKHRDSLTDRMGGCVVSDFIVVASDTAAVQA